MNKLFKLSLFFVAALTLIGMQSCKTTKNSGEKIENISGTWMLKSLNGMKAKDIFKDKIPVMNIDAENNTIYGHGGCNSYSGPFVFKKGVLSAPDVAATMRMCIAENREPAFFGMLTQPNTTKVSNNVLTLSNKKEVVAEFTRGIDQDMLKGKWVLESIEKENMKSLFKNSKGLPTLEFDIEDNKIMGNASCNNYRATYEIEGTSIEVKQITSTRRACPNMEGENLFTETISETSDLAVTKDKLIFSKNGKTTLKFKKKK